MVIYDHIGPFFLAVRITYSLSSATVSAFLRAFIHFLDGRHSSRISYLPIIYRLLPLTWILNLETGSHPTVDVADPTWRLQVALSACCAFLSKLQANLPLVFISASMAFITLIATLQSWMQCVHITVFVNETSYYVGSYVSVKRITASCINHCSSTDGQKPSNSDLGNLYCSLCWAALFLYSDYDWRNELQKSIAKVQTLCNFDIGQRIYITVENLRYLDQLFYSVVRYKWFVIFDSVRMTRIFVPELVQRGAL